MADHSQLTAHQPLTRTVEEFLGEAANAPIVRGEIVDGLSETLLWQLSPNHVHGQRLGDANGAPFRASRIRIWAPYVHWSYQGGQAGTFITHPLNDRVTAGRGWQFQGLYQRSIVFFQRATRGMIPGMSSAEAGDFTLNGSQDLWISVNDGVRESDYAENTGSYEVVITKMS